MCGRRDGNRLHGHVNSVFHAFIVYIGETVHQEIAGVMRNVQQDIFIAGLLDFVVNGFGHDIARRKTLHRMIFFHEGRSVFQLENTAFATDGFADQKGLCLWMKQAGGMKLDKLHVCNFSARTVGHGDAITRGNVGIGGDQIHLAGTARAQDSVFGAISVNPVLIDIQNIGAQTVDDGSLAVFLDDQVNADMIFIDFNVRQCGDSLVQCAFNFPSGKVLGVQDTPPVVTPFLSQIVKMRGLFRFCEIDSPINQFLDSWRSFPNHKFNNFFIAQARTAIQCVFDVVFKTVRFVRHGGNSALGVIGVGF